MSPALNGSSLLYHFKHSKLFEIRNGIMFDFYPELLQILFPGIKHTDPQYNSNTQSTPTNSDTLAILPPSDSSMSVCSQ